MLRHLLVGILLVAQTSQLTPEQIRERLEPLLQQAQQLVEQLPKQRIITTPAELTAALLVGGEIQLQADTSFAGAFTVSKSGTRIIGNGSTLAAGAAPALRILPAVVDVDVSDLSATSSFSGGVIQCGDNGPTQTSVAQQPERITFRNVTVPTHRGKRGFELNCSATILGSSVSDLWASSLQDSQAILISNTCGPVRILGGTYVAGSENIMVGGDTLKITNCPEGVAADIVIDSVTLSKPESWHTDGINRGVKNLLELKAGKRVIVRQSTLSGSWKAAQDGYAIVITPRNAQYIEDVLLEGLTVDRVGAGINLMGINLPANDTKFPTSKVVLRDSSFVISSATYGGRGILALITNGTRDFTLERVSATFNGNAIVQAESSTPQGPLTMRESRMPTGRYAIFNNGILYGAAPPAGSEQKAFPMVLESNALANAPSQFKALYPSNTWLSLEQLATQRGTR
jgi:hypothetical protein